METCDMIELCQINKVYRKRATIYYDDGVPTVVDVMRETRIDGEWVLTRIDTLHVKNIEKIVEYIKNKKEKDLDKTIHLG